MRAFAKPFPLQRLSLEARILYSAFLVFMVMALMTSAWLGLDSGLTHRDAVARYYLGGAVVVAGPAVVVGGPLIDVADAPAEVDPPKSARQVIETFHFHAFTIPVVLLILGHMFFMTALSTRTKVITLVLATLSSLVHLLAPVITRFVTPTAASLFVPSAVVMTVSWLCLAMVPLVQMWRSPRDHETVPATTD
jgi:hypothetical protein